LLGEQYKANKKMKETFLCSQCRIWLENNPDQMKKACHNGYRSAIHHYEQGELEDAFRNAGTAFEMAAIMIDSDKFVRSYSTDGVVAICELFVRILNSMDRRNDSIDIQQRAILLVNDKAGHSELKRVMPKLAQIANLLIHSEKHQKVFH